MTTYPIERESYVTKISDAFNLDHSDVLNFIDYYNSNYDLYDNKIYEKIETRIAHLNNFLSKDWFSKRIYYYLNKIDKYDLIIDIGFSIPYFLFYESTKNNKNDFLLIDNQDSAIDFFDFSMSIASNKDPHNITAKKMDIESNNATDFLKLFVSNKKYSSVLFVASEVVEHLYSPDSFWQLAKELSLLVDNFNIYATLPIGEKIPSHTIEFLNFESAKKHASKYIYIHEELRLSPPRNLAASPHLKGCFCAMGEVL